MKKLLILSLAIFCFYGCKSLNTESETTGLWGNPKATASQFKQIFKGTAGLYGFFMESVCDHSTQAINIEGKRYREAKAIYNRVEKTRTDYFLKNKDFKDLYDKAYFSDKNWDGYADSRASHDFKVHRSTYTYQELVDKGDYLELKEWYFHDDPNIERDESFMRNVSFAKDYFKKQSPNSTMTSKDKNISEVCDIYQAVMEEEVEGYLVQKDDRYRVDLYHSKTKLHKTVGMGHWRDLEDMPYAAIIEHSCETKTNQSVTLTKTCSQSNENTKNRNIVEGICFALVETILNTKDYQCKTKDLTYTVNTLKDIEVTPY